MLIPIVVFVVVALIAESALSQVTYRGFGAAMLGWYGLKLALAAWPVPRQRRSARPVRIGVVITNYNQDPEDILKCLRSIAAQTIPAAGIIFVDDFSKSRAGMRAAEAFKRNESPVPMLVHRQPRNMGKRHGLAYGFRALALDVDVYLCIDSDTLVSPHTIAEGVRMFGDERVVAATGACIASNATKNPLTLVENLRYVNAFYGERQALSRVGSVLCVSGAVAFWRARHVHLVLEQFIGQRVLGKEANVGDDRHLTNLLLPYGRITFIPGAIAYTEVPEGIRQYRRQQIRWGRSFWLESLWLLKGFRLDRLFWWLCLGDLLFGAAAAVNLVWIAADLALTGTFHAAEYLWLSFLWSYARSSYVLAAPRGVISTPLALFSFALSGLNTLLSTFLVTPLRIWSALTWFRVGWLTRADSGPETGSLPLGVPGGTARGHLHIVKNDAA